MTGAVSKTARKVSDDALRVSRARLLTKWLAAARAKHGDRFDYSLVQERLWVGQRDSTIDLVCREHGPFRVTALKHLAYSGGGCEPCGLRRRGASKINGAAAKFLAFVDTKLSGRLEVRSAYVGAKEPVLVRCLIHGVEKSITPDGLMQNPGAGCETCTKENRQTQRLTLEQVRAKFDAKMPPTVSITDVLHQMGRQTRVMIDCVAHGRSEVSVGYLTKCGDWKCPKCGKERMGNAWSNLQRLIREDSDGRPTVLAVMEVEVFGITAIKVGITRRTIEARYQESVKKIYLEENISERIALAAEIASHVALAHCKDWRVLLAGVRGGRRWAGDTELYRLDDKIWVLETVRGEMQRFRDGANPSVVFAEAKTDEWAVFRLPVPTKHRPPPVPIMCVETGERFPSLLDAANAKGVGLGNIWKAINSKKGSRVNGLRWVREEDYLAGKIPAPRERGAHSRRQVICKDTGKVFESASAAARWAGCSNSHIVTTCKGKRASTGGYEWRYFDVTNGELSPEFLPPKRRNRRQVVGDDAAS